MTPDDDTITTYSSRGPTRFEVGLKPDVVAPGNKIVSLRAHGSYLGSQYPDLHVAGSGNNGYMKMSGTSMAAGMVSGGAALLLEGGALTARQIKLAMQLSASFMTDEGLLRAGLGRVNLYSARRVNNTVTSLTGVVPSVTIAGRTVRPSGLMTMGGQPLIDGLLAPVGTSGARRPRAARAMVRPVVPAVSTGPSPWQPDGVGRSSRPRSRWSGAIRRRWASRWSGAI